jgi:putative membrane protein
MNIAQSIALADMWDGDVGWGWMSLMMVVMVLFWGAIIFGIVWLIRGGVRGEPAHSAETRVSRETPVQILERRFAEGAISPDDYRARREILSGAGGPNGAFKDEPLAASPTGKGRQ